jgi:(p)ppGpp synthase/HD superfamily hydrolase
MTTNNTKILHNKAAIFAVKAHAGQFRKDGVTSYVTHPLRVANLLTLHNANDNEIFCGLWHDILEDCPEKIHIEMINELVSYNLESSTNNEILYTLMAVCKPADGNRKTRLEKFVKQIINSGESAILVKICDRIDNVMDSEGLGNFRHEYVVNETGYVIDEFSNLDLNERCNSALCTLKTVRREIMKKNEWEM